MGTGGGERFLELLDGYDGLTVATEGWSGNIHIASQALSPFGARLVHSSGLNLPFSDGCFELVLNDHEELSPADVARILSPGGSFLTQQVGHNNCLDALLALEQALYKDDHIVLTNSRYINEAHKPLS